MSVFLSYQPSTEVFHIPGLPIRYLVQLLIWLDSELSSPTWSEAISLPKKLLKTNINCISRLIASLVTSLKSTSGMLPGLMLRHTLRRKVD